VPAQNSCGKEACQGGFPQSSAGCIFTTRAKIVKKKERGEGGRREREKRQMIENPTSQLMLAKRESDTAVVACNQSGQRGKKVGGLFKERNTTIAETGGGPTWKGFRSRCVTSKEHPQSEHLPSMGMRDTGKRTSLRVKHFLRRKKTGQNRESKGELGVGAGEKAASPTGVGLSKKARENSKILSVLLARCLKGSRGDLTRVDMVGLLSEISTRAADVLGATAGEYLVSGKKGACRRGRGGDICAPPLRGQRRDATLEGGGQGHGVGGQGAAELKAF